MSLINSTTTHKSTFHKKLKNCRITCELKRVWLEIFRFKHITRIGKKLLC